MSKSEKILISGIGRCGTTFLIKIFSFIGMDTGYTINNYKKYIFSNCNSGMEKSITSPNYVIKSPRFIGNIDEIIKSIKIKYMVIPIRDYTESAQSRAIHKNGNGGFWNAKDVNDQVLFYKKVMDKYNQDMRKYNIPTIFIDFNKMINNKEYLFDKLKPILNENNVSKETFIKAYNTASTSSKPPRKS